MSAQLRVDDTDGVTVITTTSLGNVPTPGTSIQKKVYLENFGDQTAQSATVAIEQLGTNDGSTYAQLAPDVSGSPGTFSNATLNLGNIAVASKVAFWTEVVLISGLTADNNPRKYNLLAQALTI